MAADAATAEPAPADAEPEPAPPLTLEATVPAELASRLGRHPALAALRSGRGRGGAEERIWFDTAEGRLGAAGLAPASDLDLDDEDSDEETSRGVT